MTDFNDRIERLAELEGKATPGEWNYQELIIYSNPEFPRGVLSVQYDRDASFVCALRNEALPLLREMAQALSEARAENERLRARQAKLKETLLPVCEYGAEIYNRGIPAIPMPDDTIQRLNWAFKMFGG